MLAHWYSPVPIYEVLFEGDPKPARVCAACQDMPGDVPRGPAIELNELSISDRASELYANARRAGATGGVLKCASCRTPLMVVAATQSEALQSAILAGIA